MVNCPTQTRYQAQSPACPDVTCDVWDSGTENLLLAVPDLSTTQSIRLGFVETMSRVRVNFDLQDPSLDEETDTLIQKILSAHQPHDITGLSLQNFRSWFQVTLHF